MVMLGLCVCISVRVTQLKIKSSVFSEWKMNPGHKGSCAQMTVFLIIIGESVTCTCLQSVVSNVCMSG